MPSSITLTVHSLPQSTSFFLSALQPLDYHFRGRSGNTIGFGSVSDSSRPPDFWITQEIPGVPASAAHVAFPASSHREVQQFFAAARKAGGKTHGEPAIRDSSGYYSAAVIDFDGNSIEAVYRPSYSDDKENVTSKAIMPQAGSTVSRATALRSEAAYSTVASSKVSTTGSFRERDRGRTIDGDVLDNIFAEVRALADTARNAMKTFRPSPSTMKSEPIIRNTAGDNKAAVGTLLGVAAGAALTYAFTSNDDGPRRPVQSRSKTLPFERSDSVYHGGRRSSLPSGRVYEMNEIEYAIGTSRGRRNSTASASSVASEPRSSHSRRSGSHSRFEPIRMIEAPSSPSHRPSSRSRSAASEASTVKPMKYAPVATGKSGKSKAYPPSAFPGNLPTPPSTVATARKYPFSPSRSTAVYTPTRDRSQSRSSKHRQPEEYPLPSSRRGSAYTSYTPDEHRSRRSSIMDVELTPDDSISQISVNPSRSGRSRRR